MAIAKRESPGAIRRTVPAGENSSLFEAGGWPWCPSHLSHLPQKPWNFPPPPDTLSGMQKIIEMLLAVFREIFLRRAALDTEIHPSASR